MSIVIGIDPSLSMTSVVILQRFEDGRERFEKIRVATKAFGHAANQRFPRYLRGVRDIMRGIERSEIYIRGGINRIAIEHYAFASTNAYDESLVEYGALLRLSLLELVDDLFEIPPSTLKLWAIGKGQSPKDVYCKAIEERETIVPIFDDNDADAVGIARIAQQYFNYAPCRDSAAERYAISELQKPKLPKPKKKKRGDHAHEG